jgi:hypothetical protein
MKAVKETTTKMMNNPIGTLAGGVGAYYLAKKYGKVDKWYYLVGIAVVGAVVGAMAQSKLTAKSSLPKPSDAVVKK